MIKTTDTRPTALDVSLPAGEVTIAVQPGLERGSVVLEQIREDDDAVRTTNGRRRLIRR